VTITTRVRNVSEHEWLQDLSHQINVANHWLDEGGATVVHDDGRARLPGRLGPGDTCELALPVVAPLIGGRYLLEVDVVQESTAWFADRGSPTARVPLVVHEPDRHQVAAADPTTVPTGGHGYPTFMMRGIERSAVEALISELGGDVLEAREHVTEWVSYRYTTRRR
jgi:hypothetical protein